MTRNQAAEFVQALNAMGPYVPPILFNGAMQSDCMRMIVAIANGQIKFGAPTLASVPAAEKPTDPPAPAEGEATPA